MQHTTQIILAVVSMIIGGLGSLTMLVMLMAGGANSSEAQIRQIKWMMLSVAVVQVLALAGSIWLLVAHRGWASCGVGLIPFIYAIVLVTVLVKLEW